MSDIKRRLTSEGIEILTIRPKLPEGRSAPDPMRPPPFAASKPKPAGETPKTTPASAGRTKRN